MTYFLFIHSIMIVVIIAYIIDFKIMKIAFMLHFLFAHSIMIVINSKD